MSRNVSGGCNLSHCPRTGNRGSSTGRVTNARSSSGGSRRIHWKTYLVGIGGLPVEQTGKWLYCGAVDTCNPAAFSLESGPLPPASWRTRERRHTNPYRGVCRRSGVSFPVSVLWWFSPSRFKGFLVTVNNSWVTRY